MYVISLSCQVLVEGFILLTVITCLFFFSFLSKLQLKSDLLCSHHGKEDAYEASCVRTHILNAFCMYAFQLSKG